jgi:hypothetical protein
MKDYSVLKSSREMLLKMAGYKEGHILFKISSLNRLFEFQVAGAQNDSGSPGNQD